MIDTALKVSQSLYCFTTFIWYGFENYFPRLWGTGISDAIFKILTRLAEIELHVINSMSKTSQGLL